MQRKNKRKPSGGYLIPMPFAVMLVVISGLALFYLWLCERCDAVGQDLKALEGRRISLQKSYLNEEYRWANLRSPANVDMLLKKHGLTMTWPSRDQIVRLTGTHDLLSQEVAEMARYRGLERVVMND